MNGAEIPDPGEIEKDVQRARLDTGHRIAGGIIEEEETRPRTSLDQRNRQQMARRFVELGQAFVQIEWRQLSPPNTAQRVLNCAANRFAEFLRKIFFQFRYESRLPVLCLASLF